MGATGGTLPAGAVFTALPVVVTERLRLRPLRPEDAADLFAEAADPEVARYTAWAPHRSVADAEAVVATVLERYARGEPAPWGVEHTADGRLIGTCGFNGWLPRHGRAEVSYALARPYWGRGLMPEALRAVLACGFGRLGLNRVEARCLVENVASARVLEKVGMRCEGVLREHVFLKGAYRDLKLYAVLGREWRERPGTPP